MNLAMLQVDLAHTTRTPIRRNVLVAVGVLVVHMLVVWRVQSGALRPAVEVLVPVHILVKFISPPAITLAPPPAVPNQHPVAKSPIQTRAPVSQPLPAMPMTVSDTTLYPAATAERTTAEPHVPVLTPSAAAMALAPAAPPAPAAPQRVELPSTNAEYLQNPKPLYPGMSKRLGEQGQVIHSVLIGEDGLPVSAVLVKSSGFDRLDQAAYTAVMRWHYVPGKRNGVPTAMSFNVPINWVFE